MQNRIYFDVSFHMLFFFNMKNEVTGLMVVEQKSVFFFLIREVGSSDACVAPVQVHLRK